MKKLGKKLFVGCRWRFWGLHEISLKEKEGRGPEFGLVLVTATLAKIQNRQKPGRQAANLPLCACDLTTILQVKSPTGSGAETGQQLGSIS